MRRLDGIFATALLRSKALFPTRFTPRLLFLAHRKEILDQARTTFRHVLTDASFGALLGDGITPYNEGVDLPFVDALLLLRPTQSATLFIQQIGRGLRHHDKKPSCLVLDFIGQHHKSFRFDTLLRALTGIPRARLRREVERGFPYLPSGCVLQLDHVARARVLDSLRATLGTRTALVEEVRTLEPPTLASYLEQSGREPEDVYNAGGWTKLRHDAGVLESVDDQALDLSKRLGQLLHIDEPTRLRAIRAVATSPRWDPQTDADRVRATMLDARLEHRGTLRAAEDLADYVRQHPPIAEELTQLTDVLEERIATPADVYPVPEWPLALHRHYTRIEIVTAVGYLHPGKKKGVPQGGILKLDSQKRELLFVTLDKSAKSFSPTTRYRDYAISRDRFHWETQGAASVERASGRRYIESPGNGWSFYLFVRTEADAPYAFLGAVRYEGHRGDRPIGITWRLESGMPPGLFERFGTLVQG